MRKGVNETIKKTVARVITRMVVRRVSVAVWRCGMIAGLGALGFLYLIKAGGASHVAVGWALGIWGIGIGVGLILGCSWILQPYEAAKFIDDAAELNDRLSSAYGFIQSGKSGGLTDLAIRDAEDAAERIRLSDIVPSPVWGRLVLSAVAIPILLVTVQRELFPPPVIQKDETFRPEELGAALSALDMAIDDPQTFQLLQEELKKLGVGETTEKSELLARLNRTIAELKLQAEKDEGVLNILAQMEKFKSKLGLAELQMRADAELRQVEELVTDEGVQAEIIMVDPLVDTTTAKRIAQGLKEVAGEQLAAGEGGVEVGEGQDPGSKPSEGQTNEDGPKKNGGEKKKTSKEELLAVQAISDQAIRKRILKVARDADRSSEDYSVVYRNYRRAFLAELFRIDLGSGRKEYLERYFHTIRPEQP